MAIEEPLEWKENPSIDPLQDSSPLPSLDNINSPGNVNSSYQSNYSYKKPLINPATNVNYNDNKPSNIGRKGQASPDIGGAYAPTVICCCCILALFIPGYILLQKNSKFNKESEQTLCTIQSSTSIPCSYNCHCHYNKDGEKVCDTCYGFYYQYTATTDLCSDQTLTQKWGDIGSNCPEIVKSKGYQQTCWASCNDKQFVFNDPSHLLTIPIFLLVMAGFLCLCTLFYCGSILKERL